MRYDAIVVGAGPAGSYAAYLLAKRGAAVALLDRVVVPAREAVRRRAVAQGARPRRPRPLAGDPRAGDRRLARARRARGVLRHAGVVAAMTLRTELDAFLIEHAVGAGATFHPQTNFLDVETRGRRRARRDFAGRARRAPPARRRRRRERGATPRLRRRRGRVRAGGRSARVRAAGGACALPRSRPARSRRACRAATAGSSASATTSTSASTRSAGRAASAAISRRSSRAIRRSRRCERIRYLGYPIPVANRARRFEHGPVWLLGDAAGSPSASWGRGSTSR